MYKDLVIPNDASKDQIITLLSTIFDVKNKNINIIR
jgi:ribosomal protein L23